MNATSPSSGHSNWFLVWRLACTLFLVLASPPALAQADAESAWQLVRERWFTIEINGARAGWASETLYDDGAHFKLVSEQMISVARGESEVATVSLSLASIESHDGGPVEIRLARRLGAAPEETTWEFANGGVERISVQDGREVRTPEPLEDASETWLMPHAAERFEQARRAAGAAEIEYRTIDTSAGLRLVTIAQQKSGEATHRVDDRAVPVTAWTVRKSTSAGEVLSQTTVHIASDGALVFAEEVAGVMRFTIRAASRDAAMAVIAAAPELLSQTVVRPSQRIPAAAKSIAATYRLRPRTGSLPEFPSAGAQRAESEDDSTVLLTVDTRTPQAATEEEIADPRYLAASAVVDCADAEIVTLAREVVARLDDATPQTKADALRLAAYRHIARKGLASAFATASETVRSRSGDCSEHAVLLCALLRAEAIPARIASGLVYAESFAGARHVFAWHMWTQALIEGRWIDLDATAPGPYSAAHILAGVTDLSRGALGDEITRMVGLMGNLDIEVVAVEHR